MKNEIKVPSMGESISEVTIGQILVNNGTIIQVDSELLELETDKVNQMLYAPQTGRLNLTVKAGDKVKIGQVIGTIESVSQESVSKTKENPSQELSDSSLPQKPAKKEVSSIQQPSSEQSIRYTKENFLRDLQLPSTSFSVNPPLPSIETKKEIKDQPLAVPSATIKEKEGRETRRLMSNIRKVIGKRMIEAQQTMAMLTTFNEIDLTQVIQLREKYKESFTKKYGCKLGFMSFFVKATVSALGSFPDLNSYIDGEEIVHREYYNIGVAVGTEKGVIVPVLRNCDQLSFAEIELAIENYVKKAKSGELAVSDLTGGGFTITNGGIYGSLLSTPILIPPQCGILGMHKIEKRPVVINDQVTIRSMMYVALSYDHRLIDGKEAVSFLLHVKEMLEDPSRLLLDI